MEINTELVKHEKWVMEEAVLAAVERFESAAGLAVTSIRLDRRYVLDGVQCPLGKLVGVRALLEIAL
jgi:hypothetical protein